MNHRLIALCVISFWLAACASSGTTQTVKEKKGDIYFTAGIESIEAGQYTDALASLREAVKFIPKSAPAWTALGLAYLGKEDAGQAEESWKRAIAIDGSYTDARLNLGALYINQRRFKDAEKQLKEAAGDLTYSRSYQVKYNLGVLYAQQGKLLPAEQNFKLAVKENEFYCPAWFRLGMLQKDRGELGESEKAFKRAISGECFTANPQAHYELGTVYLKAKEPALAKARLLELIQFFPDSDWARKAEITLNMMR